MNRGQAVAGPLAASTEADSDAQKADELISAIAERIVSRSLEAPAILFLELHKPLAFILGQAAIVAAPLWGLFLSPDEIETACRALGSPQAIETLIERIEHLSTTRRSGSAP